MPMRKRQERSAPAIGTLNVVIVIDLGDGIVLYKELQRLAVAGVIGVVNTDLLVILAVCLGDLGNGIAYLNALSGGDGVGIDNDLKHPVLAVERIGINDKAAIGVGLILALAVAAKL